MAKLFGIFIIVPLIELVVLLEVGEIIGFWWTVFTIIVTAVAGASLARAQGLAVFWKLKQELSGGRIPAGAMIESILILLAGVVLLTPGFITDFIGFAILIPPVRKFLQAIILARIQVQFRFNSENTGMSRKAPSKPSVGLDGEVKSNWRVESESN